MLQPHTFLIPSVSSGEPPAHSGHHQLAPRQPCPRRLRAACQHIPTYTRLARNWPVLSERRRGSGPGCALQPDICAHPLHAGHGPGRRLPPPVCPRRRWTHPGIALPRGRCLCCPDLQVCPSVRQPWAVTDRQCFRPRQPSVHVRKLAPGCLYFRAQHLATWPYSIVRRKSWPDFLSQRCSLGPGSSPRS